MTIPEMTMPERYRKMKSRPEDPPYSRPYGYETPGAGCFVMVCPIPAGSAMPYENPRVVIDGIHRQMGENQGLIAVEAGRTNSGRRFLYSVVKTLLKPHGAQYCLTMHVEHGTSAVQIQGFFDELGTTGTRDAMVYIMLEKQNLVKVTEEGIAGWTADPYDPGYTRGSLMNCSERKQYDAAFPQHPLSELRRFAAEVIGLN